MEILPQQLKVLVADDSPLYRKLVEQALLPKQFSVMFAKNGREAIDLFGVHQPPLLIYGLDDARHHGN